MFLKRAIEQFRAKRLNVYKADPIQLSRDARAADRAATDHTGRWMLELLQNSDDAGANEIRIIVDGESIYFADNGSGFKPSGVESISGTDFSDKTTNTIGRKGIGFKAVYSISDNPQIYTVYDEGMQFALDKAQEWISINELPKENSIPFQWLPFYKSRSEAKLTDNVIAGLDEYSTIIKIPLTHHLNIKELLTAFPAYGLLPFRTLRKIEIYTCDDLDISLEIEAIDERLWSVKDSRYSKSELWCLEKTSPQIPPNSLLDTINDKEERNRVQNNGISFLVATPMDDNRSVIPLDDYIPIYVFYPAEKDISPVPVLLHAEFIVKSDRTSIVPIEKGSFNEWVANNLIRSFIDFIRNSYSPDEPSAFLRLLSPFEERNSHPITQYLWTRIVYHVKSDLLLPDRNGSLTLAFENARLLDVSVEIIKARIILEGSSDRLQLIHQSIDGESNARTALVEMDIERIDDSSFINAIERYSKEKLSDHDWIWNCWEWLSSWITDKPWGEEYENRKMRLKKLTIIPISGDLHSIDKLDEFIVTWQNDNKSEELPEWLPIRFIDNWFRDKLLDKDEPNSEAIVKLITEIGIKKPNVNTVLQSLIKAIKQWWDERDDKPQKYIEFLKTQNWHSNQQPIEGLNECPVETYFEHEEMSQWVKAGEAYFSQDWDGYDILALYQGDKSIAWVRKLETDSEEDQLLYKWLGVVSYPRVIKEKRGNENEHTRFRKFMVSGSYPKWYQPSPLYLDRIFIEDLDVHQSIILIKIITKNWQNYFSNNYQVEVKCEGPRGGWKSSQSAPARWWEQLIEELKLPLLNNELTPGSLTACWLPEKTILNLKRLIPIIDIGVFEEDKKQVNEWLRNVLHVRKGLDEISFKEWEILLSEKIPSIVGEDNISSNTKYKDQVKKWYEACLESFQNQDNPNDISLNNVPLLCRKGDVYKYVTGDTRWLADDNYASESFREDIWQITLRERYWKSALKYFDTVSISASLNKSLRFVHNCCRLNAELQSILDQGIPYVYAWRLFKSKSINSELRENLLKLRVETIDNISILLELEGIGERIIPSNWGVDCNRIIIKLGNGNAESFLAEALSECLEVRADAEFIENLFRCNTDNDRRSKLFSKGLPNDEIERLLRDFENEVTEIEVNNGFEGETLDDIEESSNAKIEEQLNNVQIKRSGAKYGSSELSTSTELVEPTETAVTEPEQNVHDQFNLKEPTTAEIIIVNMAPTEDTGDNRRSTEGGFGDSNNKIITHDQKLEIEEAGRKCTARVLEENGWNVEIMAFNQPGFDLKASKLDRNLLVEVKSHYKSGSVVEISVRQYEEYNRSKNMKDFPEWVLCNVENLAIDSGNVIVAFYDTIPSEAIRERTFAIHLRLCESKVKL
jgi:hypothetical protein